MKVAAVAALIVLALAGCGGGAGDDPEARDRAWSALLVERGLTPDQEALRLAATVADGSLTITITVPAGRAGDAVFGDGLFGAEAYAYEDGRWARVDTADVRTEIAPILGPGASATVELPVANAEAYRVLVPLPAERVATWADT